MHNSGPSPLHHPWFWMLSNAPDNVTIGFCALDPMSLHGTSNKIPQEETAKSSVDGNMPKLGTSSKHYFWLLSQTSSGIHVLVGRKTKAHLIFWLPWKEGPWKSGEGWAGSTWFMGIQNVSQKQTDSNRTSGVPIISLQKKTRNFRMLLTWPFPVERRACFYLFSCGKGAKEPT